MRKQVWTKSNKIQNTMNLGEHEMDQSEILEMLKGYIVREILDGKDIGLDESTPLLEWGIINSMEIARILTFIENRFHFEISEDKILPEHFINLSAISALVTEVKVEDKKIGREEEQRSEIED